MKKIKTIQKASSSRIKADRTLSPTQAVQFIEEFQQVLHGDEGKRKLISLRVPEKLLNQFRKKSQQSRIPYQSQIIELMREWIKK